ncbi:MAG: hypothetical protein IJD38_04835, partial [Clostridia bacterium]|nr:hypothetical protein [Clostridia bacterium]
GLPATPLFLPKGDCVPLGTLPEKRENANDKQFTNPNLKDTKAKTQLKKHALLAKFFTNPLTTPAKCAIIRPIE